MRRAKRPPADRAAETGLDSGSTSKLDQIDRAIIELLQSDGRLTYSAIGQKLGLSDGAVRKRMARMTDEKVFRVLAVADPIKLGYTGYAMLLLKLTADADPEETGAYFRDRPEVSYVVFTAEQYDLLVEVICESHEKLREFVVEHCYGRKDISSVEPMLSLKIFKNLLVWGRPIAT